LEASLYLSCREELEIAAFYRLCDGKGKTLTVIKNTEGFVFGGFAPTPWSSVKSLGVYKADNTSFLFSLTNPSGRQLKLKVTQQEEAVYHHSGWGLTFGAGHPLYVCGSSNINRNSYISSP